MTHRILASLVAFILFPLSAPLASGQQTLETLPVDAGGELEYRLLTGGPCDEEACSARLVLASGDRELSAVQLERTFVAGLEPQRREGCWYTRIEGADLEICASAMRLTPDFNGIMLSQSRGWDHVRQNQMLFVALDDTLAMVWDQDNGIGGPYWTRAWVADVDGDGNDEIVSLTEAEGYMPDAADRWSLITLGWDTGVRDIRWIRDPERALVAYAAIVGSFETLDEAREYKERVGYATNDQGRRVSCLLGFLVLASSEYPQLTPDWFIVAALSIDESEAAVRLEKAKACNPEIDGYLKRAQ